MMKKVKQPSNLLQKFFLLMIGLEIVFFFLCSDIYMQISGFYLPLLPAMVVGVIWLYKNFWKISHYQFAFLTLFIGIILASYNSFYQNESGYLFSYIMLIFMAFILTTMDLDEKEVEFLSHCYILVGLIIAFIIEIVRYRYYALETRYTIKIGDNPALDPNYLAAFLIGPFLLALRFVAKRETIIQKLIYIGFAIIIAFGVFLTESRGGLLSVILMTLLVLIRSIKRRLNKKETIIILCALAVLTGIALILIPTKTFKRMFNISTWIDASNKKRLGLWVNAVNAIAHRPLFGFGLAATENSFVSVTGMYGAAHNTLLELWGQVGILAIVALVDIAIILFRKKSDWYGQVLFIGTIAVSLFISCEATLMFWLNIAFCLILAKMNVKKERQDEFFNQCYRTGVQCRKLPRSVFRKYMRANV